MGVLNNEKVIMFELCSVLSKDLTLLVRLPALDSTKADAISNKYLGEELVHRIFTLFFM